LTTLVTLSPLKADPSKLEAMAKWPIPKTVKQLIGFLALTGIIANYASIAAPLTDLLCHEAFEWTALQIRLS